MRASPPIPNDSAPRRETIGVILAFAAGYVDTVGFVALFGLFTAHVTGNFVLIGSELAHPTHGVLIKLLAFPAVIPPAVVARLLVLHAEHRSKSGARALLVVQAVLLSGAMTAGCLAAPAIDLRSALALSAGILAAAAMGIQNAASRLIWRSLSPTTVMTGNVTLLTIDMVDLWQWRTRDDLGHRIRKFFWPVIGFAAGALLGGVAFGRFSFVALAVPIALLGALVPLSGKAPEHPIG